MIYIGIDPGFEGAIAHINAKHAWLASGFPMPITGTGKDREIDMAAIALRLTAIRNADVNVHVFLEKAQAMPKQGVSSTFKFGVGYGKIQAILSTMRIPYTLITPMTWKKAVLVGLAWKGNKAASIQWAQKAYPDFNLRRTPRSTTDHDGLADALCLAEYGRILNV